MLLPVLLFAASAAAQPARDMPVINPAPEARFCPETPMSFARKMGKRPPHAIPLSKLPPAQTFMAVDRRIAGCPAPLTMSDYRTPRRR
ncbi:MAG TPA: hypothetical protein VFK28_13260 [Sphingomicrobium sp.]|jgi:hypothetical protein|nr:hypothetical protein [Sphingomicrobium sp.]